MNSINNFSPKNIYSRGIQKKPEEKVKGEEVKPEESVKEPVVKPTTEKITAKADEILTNYIKGQIHTPGDRGGVRPKRPPVPGTPVDPNAGVVSIELEELINQWNTTNETLDNQAKFDLLTQIIDAFGENDERIMTYRVIRYGVGVELRNQDLLDYLHRLKNGEPYYHLNNPVNQGTYLMNPDDYNAFCNFADNYNNLSPEQLLAYQQTAVSWQNRMTLSYLIEFEHNPENNAVNGLRDYSEGTVRGINNIANNPENAGEAWAEVFVNDYNSLFYNFWNNINNLSQSEIESMVNDMQRLIAKLRDGGCPYCDQLLVAIQGILIGAGHDEIDVLPYPENGG